MKDIIKNLIDVGFSKVEAQVYASLISVDKMGGYQIAKLTGISRPSVYSALESLLAKGCVTSIPGNTVEYRAVSPEILFDEMSSSFAASCQKAKKCLESLKAPFFSNHEFSNIEGKENLIRNVNRVIHLAQKEIIMNCTMPLDFFAEELKLAENRGVRIVLFTWADIQFKDIKIEFYSGYSENSQCADERIFVVSDFAHCVVGSNERKDYIAHGKDTEKLPNGEKDFFGMISDNRLMVNLVTEHIHFDIYLNRLKQKHKKNLVTKDIQIQTMMEKGL